MNTTTRTCSNCGEPGHNVRTCKRQRKSAVATLERPGRLDLDAPGRLDLDEPAPTPEPVIAQAPEPVKAPKREIEPTPPPLLKRDLPVLSVEEINRRIDEARREWYEACKTKVVMPFVVGVYPEEVPWDDLDKIEWARMLLACRDCGQIVASTCKHNPKRVSYVRPL